MKSEVLSQFHLPWLSILATSLFLFVFVGVVWLVFQSKRKPYLEAMAMLPIEEGQETQSKEFTGGAQ